MSDIEDKIKRLETAKKKAEEEAQKRSRLTGELDGIKKQLKDVKTECNEKFDCEVKELPGMIKELDELAEKNVLEAETLLGINEG